MANVVPSFAKSGKAFACRMALAKFAKSGALPKWAATRKELFAIAASYI